MQAFQNFNLSELLTEEFLASLVRAAAYIVVGFIILRIAILVLKKFLKRRVTEQARMLTVKVVNYTGIAALIVIVLLEFGVKLTPILGAAGILGLAVGIASQTSLSNLISGIFLVSEKPFAVGDVIRIGEKAGIVVSIDLLSVKIRTFDNLFIRVPNEKILNGELTNITKYPIRRMDFDISVAYKEDLRRVREILIEIAQEEPLVLDEPAAVVLFREFGDSGIQILFGVWFQKKDFIDVKNNVFLKIKQRFEDEGIEIPFPHRTLYAGSATMPFPISQTKDDPGESS